MERIASDLVNTHWPTSLYILQYCKQNWVNGSSPFKRSAFTGRVLTCDTLNRVAGEVSSDSVDGTGSCHNSLHSHG